MKRDARQEGLRWLEQAEADRYGAQLLFDGASYHLACCARLPLIPPTPFSHTGRRGRLCAFAPHPPRPPSPTRGEGGVWAS
jgi:hypothetical protein